MTKMYEEIMPQKSDNTYFLKNYNNTIRFMSSLYNRRQADKYFLGT
jgi:hypothetical protein